MPVLHESDAVPHPLHGATFHSFVAPASGSRELCAWRLEIQPGVGGTPHRVDHEEVLLILTGELSVTLDSDTAVVRPGDVIHVPAGSLLGVDNRSGDPASAWVTTVVGLRATLADGSTISPPWVR